MTGISTFEFWEQIAERGQISNDWWYDVVVLPAFVLAIFTYLLMWFALRRETKLPTMYVWLIVASMPVILIFPSFYVDVQPFEAFGLVGFERPASEQAFRLDHIKTLSTYLDQMATLGIIGGAISLVVLFASTIVGGMVPQPVAQTFTNITQAVTRAFGKRTSGVGNLAARSRHGLFRVTRGEHQGTNFGITNGAVIGKSEAAMIVTDPIVSRQHARIEIRNDAVFLVDEGSTNGTFLVRNGTPYELATPTQLYPGDKIYLGDPTDPEAVELAYEPPTPQQDTLEQGGNI